ncbi:hypothetical protein D3C81_1791130 [compost metagenome]
MLRDRNATKAAAPRPRLAKDSKPITALSSMVFGPTCASQANPRMATACSAPNTHRPRLMPSLSIHMPPITPPARLAQKPVVLAARPICVMEKPRSR